MNKYELITYYNYLNTNKTALFNSFHKLKNDRELKFSVLFEDSDNLYVDFISNIDSVEDHINTKVKKIDSILCLNDLSFLKESLEDYGRLLDESIAYSLYLDGMIKKLINN
jgi:hypothetical protein